MTRLAASKIEPGLIQRLRSLKPPIVSVEGLIIRDVTQLSEDLQMSEEAVRTLRYTAALELVAGFRVTPTACQDSEGGTFSSFESAAARLMFTQRQGGLLSMGCSSVDTLLGGGIPLHSVTELAGASGTGKTQLCLSAAALTAKAGLGVVYIDTSNDCCGRRLGEIVMARVVGKDPAHEALSRITVHRCSDLASVIGVLSKLPEACMNIHNTHIQGDQLNPSGTHPAPRIPPRLLILDCVTPILAPLLGGGEAPGGHVAMSGLGGLLQRVAVQLSLAVLITNCTVLDMDAGDDNHADPTTSRWAPGGAHSYSSTKPALGPQWSYTATHRVILSRPRVGMRIPQEGSSVNGAYGDEILHPIRAVLDKHSRMACGGSTQFCIGPTGAMDVIPPY